MPTTTHPRPVPHGSVPEPDRATNQRGAAVSLRSVSHRYPLTRDLDHGWVPALARLVSPAARIRQAVIVGNERVEVVAEFKCRRQVEGIECAQGWPAQPTGALKNRS